MKKSEKQGKVLLTLREAAKKLGVPDDLLVELIYVHPPIIDVMLVGRAPRVYADQLAALRNKWVDLAMDLINRNPALMGFALGAVKGPGTPADPGAMNVAELRRIIATSALAGAHHRA